MCNLYRIKTKEAELAQLFGADAGPLANVAEEIYPGYPALTIADGKVQAMHWGFPLLRKGKSGQTLKPKPVNNTRADKLHSPFWRSSFEHRRCLIPLEAFAEAEGRAGAKTRTWMAMPEQSLMTCAGIWRESDEWGRVFSMIMTQASGQMSAVHDRMPVILHPENRSIWLNSSPSEAMTLCVPYSGRLKIKATSDSWSRRQSGFLQKT